MPPNVVLLWSNGSIPILIKALLPGLSLSDPSFFTLLNCMCESSAGIQLDSHRPFFDGYHTTLRSSSFHSRLPRTTSDFFHSNTSRRWFSFSTSNIQSLPSGRNASSTLKGYRRFSSLSPIVSPFFSNARRRASRYSLALSVSELP